MNCIFQTKTKHISWKEESDYSTKKIQTIGLISEKFPKKMQCCNFFQANSVLGKDQSHMQCVHCI